MSELSLLVVADIHYIGKAQHECRLAERHTRQGRQLLEQAILNAKQTFQPDAIAVMGDLVDNGLAAGAGDDLIELKHLLETSGLPVVIVPGNHDGPADRILRIFEDQPQTLEINGYRLARFVDRYNSDDSASREMDSMDALNFGEGPLIAFQHNPVYPLIESNYPFNLKNATEVMDAYQRAGVLLSVSGHYHRGHSIVMKDSVGYVICPALCEEPFRFLQIRVKDASVEIVEHSLAF